MKLKLILFISLTFLLVACPSPEEDIYIDLNGFNIQASCSNIENNLNDTIICNDVFKIYLDFGSSPLAQSRLFSANAGVAYAECSPGIYLKNNVINCSIINTEVFGNHPKGTDIDNYFELHLDNSNWILDLSMVEGINEAARLQYSKNISPYLKLKDPIEYEGKIIVQLELSDGKVLSDTTKSVVIKTVD